MLLTPYRAAHSGLSSVLTFATTKRPGYSAAILSSAGATIRHGPHQGAQKSTSTGMGDFKTFFEMLRFRRYKAGGYLARQERCSTLRGECCGTQDHAHGFNLGCSI